MLLQIISIFLIMFSSVLSAPGSDKNSKQLESKVDSILEDTKRGVLFSSRNFDELVDSYRNESESPFQNFIHTLDLLLVLLSDSSDKQNRTNSNDQAARAEPTRRKKVQPDTRGTLDSIGGGHLLKLDDSYRSEESMWDSFDNFIKKLAILTVIYSQKGNHQNTAQPEPVKRNRTEPDTRGTLDSLGGGNFVRLDDSYRSEESIWDSLKNFINKLAILSVLYSKSDSSQNTTTLPEPAKRNRTEPDTRGTLDSIGGGNLVKLDDSYRSQQPEGSTNNGDSAQPERWNKPHSNDRHTLDSIGGGNLL